MISYLMERHYHMEDGKREARIVFISDGYNWSFNYCQYEGLNQPYYSLEDWGFLGQVAKEIARLESESD